jgi:hypothetical protein
MSARHVKDRNLKPCAAKRTERLTVMANTPKSREERMNRILNAWETLAPTKSFGGMTLAQFQAFCAPAQAARQRLGDLADQTTQATNDRDTGDEVVAEKSQLVINGVLADPTEGPNSSVYEAMGYTRKSERKSGLTKKGGSGKGGAPPPPKS